MAETFAGEPALTARNGTGCTPSTGRGARSEQMAPHIVYTEASCPHDDCEQPMQAIETSAWKNTDGPSMIPSCATWWNDHGFAGRCPRCGGWIHFTIRSKNAITAEEAAGYPQLPGDWHAKATIL